MRKIIEFLKFRNELIDRLENGEISKQAFIEFSYEYINDMKIKPFPLRGGDAIAAAICNYQYYNIKAKKALMDSALFQGVDNKRSKKCFENAMDYYEKKERVIMDLLEIIDYKNVEAYDLQVKSESLSGSLYEIVLTDYNRAVFHLLDKRIKNRLINRGLFSTTSRSSVISDYVDRVY